MASALVNNPGVTASDGFLDFPADASTTAATLSWLSPTRVSSMSGREREYYWTRDRENTHSLAPPQLSGKIVATATTTTTAVEKKAFVNAISSSSGTATASFPADDGEMDKFEFRLGDPIVGMLSADELFADGKLVPLQLAAAAAATSSTRPSTCVPAVNNSNNNIAENVELEVVERADPASVLISPRAPKCSSRWKELLRFKKAAQSAKLEQVQKAAAAAAPAHGAVHQQHSCNHAVNGNHNFRSLRHFLHRNTSNKGLLSPDSVSGSLTLPLLRGDMDASSDSISIPPRLSLSSLSSSAAADHDDLPRLSLDSERPACRNSQPPRLWISKARGVDPVRIGRSPGRRGFEEAAPPPRCASVDSPRMNSSGKVVFQNLRRSSSSPSTVGGGGGGSSVGRSKGGRGEVDRSYSTNIRITPVLNVPVCSLKSGSVFGLGLFSAQKKTERVIHRGDQQHCCGGSRSSRGVSNNNGGANRSDRE